LRLRTELFEARLVDFFVADLFAAVFLVVRLAAFFRGGTFFPSLRASESPMAIACLRLVTFFPDLPLFSVPALRLRRARPTFADALREYFRAMMLSPAKENNTGAQRWFQGAIALATQMKKPDPVNRIGPSVCLLG
jgi:hypothetical protein